METENKLKQNGDAPRNGPATGSVSLGDIIDACVFNEDVGEMDLRFAVVALDQLMVFDRTALDALARREEKNGKPFLTSSAIYQQKRRHERVSKALGKHPRDWLGKDYDPTNPENVKRRRAARQMFADFCEKQNVTGDLPGR